MIPDFVKAAFAKTFLRRLTDGDKGSTLLGSVAGAVLLSGVDFGVLAHGLHTQADAEEWGKVAAIVIMGVWGYFVGKKKKVDEGTAK